jgi:hypothetical protein
MGISYHSMDNQQKKGHLMKIGIVNLKIEMFDDLTVYILKWN